MLSKAPSCLNTIYTVTSWLILGNNFSTWSPGVATPGVLNDPGNVWDLQFSQIPHVLISICMVVTQVCVCPHGTNVKQPKKKSRNIRCQLILAPSSAICVFKQVFRPTLTIRKKTSSLLFRIPLPLLKMPVKYLPEIYLKSMGEVGIWITKGYLTSS